VERWHISMTEQAAGARTRSQRVVPSLELLAEDLIGGLTIDLRLIQVRERRGQRAGGLERIPRGAIRVGGLARREGLEGLLKLRSLSGRQRRK
jgi:hypothetical protein